ncbi:MAG: hypothetical protein Q4D05_01375, partial [Acinetobacter sp.]|nr:hypothetical protein [Acinetobacter sp.]
MKLNLGIFSTRDIDIYDSVYLQDYVQWQQQQQLIALHLDVSLFEQDCPRFREIEQMLQVDFLHKAHQQCMAKIAVAAEWQQFLQLYQSLADLLQQYHGVDVHHSE